MKKIALLVVLPYVAVIAVVAYIFFGPGLMDSSRELQWMGVKTEIPSGFTPKTYQNNGWDVYSMTKLFTKVRISVKAAFDVSTLPNHHKNVKFRISTGPDHVYYITNEHKAFLAIFARNVGDKTVFISVASGSALASRLILARVAKNASYNGTTLQFSDPSKPVSVYTVDFIMFAAFVLPVFIIFFVFYYSGKRPNARHFEGDPIRCEEEYIYFSSGTKWRRKNSFGYMVLTTTRFMVFTFKKPAWEIRMDTDDPDTRIDIDGKKITVFQKDRKIVLKPSDIKKWKDCLSSYM